MPSDVNKYFSEADFEAIKSAVADCESRTSGEIVIRLTARSHNWLLDRLVAASLTAVIAMAVSLLLTREHNWGVYYDFTQATLWTIVGFAAGFFGIGGIVGNPARRRRIVWDRALQLFSTLTPTRGSTGVLIFVSLAEKSAVIIADKQIASKVDSTYWDYPQSIMQKSMAENRHSEGIISAVREIGAKLAENFPRLSDDTNELSDRPEII